MKFLPLHVEIQALCVKVAVLCAEAAIPHVEILPLCANFWVPCVEVPALCVGILSQSSTVEAPTQNGDLQRSKCEHSSEKAGNIGGMKVV